MNIDVIKRLALDGDLFAIQALVDRPEALEKVFGHLGTPDEVGNEWHALSERLEAAESDALEQARLNGMGGEREAALLAKLEAAEKERDALRARIEAMERQEPVAWMLNCQTLGGDTGWILSWTQSGAGLCNRLKGEENEKRLYALPVAKGDKK